MDLPDFFCAQSRSTRQRGLAGWPSHPATHAGENGEDYDEGRAAAHGSGKTRAEEEGFS